jgi:hypothetical protein
MFAGEPPSSSNPTKRPSGKIFSNLTRFVGLLLQIGGANIAAARIAPSSSPTSSSLADDKACPLTPPQHGEGRNPCLLAPLGFQFGLIGCGEKR